MSHRVQKFDKKVSRFIWMASLHPIFTIWIFGYIFECIKNDFLSRHWVNACKKLRNCFEVRLIADDWHQTSSNTRWHLQLEQKGSQISLLCWRKNNSQDFDPIHMVFTLRSTFLKSLYYTIFTAENKWTLISFYPIFCDTLLSPHNFDQFYIFYLQQ